MLWASLGERQAHCARVAMCWGSQHGHVLGERPSHPTTPQLHVGITDAYCMGQTKWQVCQFVRVFTEIEIQLIHAVQFQF